MYIILIILWRWEDINSKLTLQAWHFVELKLFCQPSSSTTFTVNTRFPSCSEPAVLKMAEDRQTVYDKFSDKGEHSTEWFEVVKNLLKLAFAGDHREVKCLCNRCQNRRILSEYEMSDHIVKHRFMSDYLVWHQYGEVQAPTPAESDWSDDEERMDDMIIDICMKYDLRSRDQHPRPGCRISVGSLPPQMRKCMMAPSWP
jgi:hypothetical protein